MAGNNQHHKLTRWIPLDYGVTSPKGSFARPEAEVPASGLDLDLSRQPWTYRTQAAHGLILAARARGTRHRLAVAITDAPSLEAKNISNAKRKSKRRVSVPR